MQELETYAGTTSRTGRRIVNTAGAVHLDLIFFSYDVSQAFAKGMAFEELSALIATELREDQFDIPVADIAIWKRMAGFESFNQLDENLNMVKPIYSFKDAPHLWIHTCPTGTLHWYPSVDPTRLLPI